MSMTNNFFHDNQLSVSEGELRREIRQLDEIHHDLSLPATVIASERWADESLGAAHEESWSQRSISRRGLLAGASVAAVGGALFAVAPAMAGAATRGVRVSSNAKGYPATLTGDLAVAALAASLENLGVYAYEAGISAAKAGKLGSVPPAVVTFASTAKAQHVDHAAVWNSILIKAGKARVTETDPALTPVVNSMFAKVKTVPALAALALEIENIAAATYQAAISEVSSSSAMQVAASIQPVEMQHAAVLNLLLGHYPVPSAFSGTSLARTPADLKA
jgi:hypothetical protein